MSKQPARRAIIDKAAFSRPDRRGDAATRMRAGVPPGALTGESQDVALEILDNGIAYLSELLRCSPEAAVERFARFAHWHLARARRTAAGGRT